MNWSIDRIMWTELLLLGWSAINNKQWGNLVNGFTTQNAPEYHIQILIAIYIMFSLLELFSIFQDLTN